MMTLQLTAPILIVDDDPAFRKLMQRTLERGGYVAVATASSAEEAHKLLQQADRALLLADMHMPHESGLDLLQTVRAECPDTATMMVTGLDDPTLGATALELGAYGYVVKPFKQTEMLVNVNNALRRRSIDMENRLHREHLEDMVKERTSDLWQAVNELEHAEKTVRRSRTETITRLATVAEHRDEDTAHHVARMSHYCFLLARAAELGDDRTHMILKASQLHDIGKIGVPDRLLLKPNAFTPEEREIMQTHAAIGHQILDGSESGLLQLAATIAHTHHEWYDGSGYPRGLAGVAIPIEGRIAAIADVFDGLSTHRIYRRAYPLGAVIEIMKKESGSHFDPTLLDLFWTTLPDVISFKQQHESPGMLPPAP